MNSIVVSHTARVITSTLSWITSLLLIKDVLYTLHEIVPYAHFGWRTEHLILAIVLIILALSLPKNPLLSSLFLSVFSLLAYSRYFYFSLGALSIASGLTAFVCKKKRSLAVNLLLFIYVALPTLFFTHSTLLHTTAITDELTSCRESESLLAKFSLSIAQYQSLILRMHDIRREIQPLQGDRLYCSSVLARLKERVSLDNRSGIPTNIHTEHALLQEILEFERYKLLTFISSGVYPKRYFGFFDLRGDTSSYERDMQSTIRTAVTIINEYTKQQQHPQFITEKEVAITFLAEGGALLLTNRTDEINRVHPVRGVGLDNFRDGFAFFADLIPLLDRECGTTLNTLLGKKGLQHMLMRPMTWREAIVGTAIMYSYEKKLLSHRYFAQYKKDLRALSLSRQFIFTSLFYNSGILFSEERVEQIEAFKTGEYLHKLTLTMRKSKDALPIIAPEKFPEVLARMNEYPFQGTSWSAVVHILQRYGAWDALSKFSDIFDEEGRFISSHLAAQ